MPPWTSGPAFPDLALSLSHYRAPLENGAGLAWSLWNSSRALVRIWLGRFSGSVGSTPGQGWDGICRP